MCNVVFTRTLAKKSQNIRTLTKQAQSHKNMKGLELNELHEYKMIMIPKISHYFSVG